MYVHMFLVGVPNGVFQDGSISKAQLVILLDKFLFVGSPAFGGKLLGLEQARKLAGLVGLGECALAQKAALNLSARQLCVTFDNDVSHLHLFFLVDDYVEYHLVLVRHVVALANFDVGVLKSFIVEIAFSQNLGAVYHVGRNLRTF